VAVINGAHLQNETAPSGPQGSGTGSLILASSCGMVGADSDRWAQRRSNGKPRPLSRQWRHEEPAHRRRADRSGAGLALRGAWRREGNRRQQRTGTDAEPYGPEGNDKTRDRPLPDAFDEDLKQNQRKGRW